MLLTKEVEVKWNSKIKNHYVNKGYKFTKMKDAFVANVEDLTKGSNVRVEVKCDYCGNNYSVTWHHRVNSNKELDKDCCGKCKKEKQKELNLLRYGVEWTLSLRSVIDKRTKTVQAKYGVDNVFQSQKIKDKIVQTNMDKYGVAWSLQNKDIKQKALNTMVEKYGVDNYSKTQEFVDRFSGENNPLWKGGVEQHRVERSTIEYRHWRKAVFERDEFTCQCCKQKGGELRGHHIENWKDNEELRYDVDNGITLCEKCHTKFHSQYGKRNNNLTQLNEFMSTHG